MKVIKENIQLGITVISFAVTTAYIILFNIEGAENIFGKIALILGAIIIGFIPLIFWAWLFSCDCNEEAEDENLSEIEQE